MSIVYFVKVVNMYRPVQIKTLPGYKIWLKYSDGIEGEIDLSHLAGKGVFSLWNDYNAFHNVRIGTHGEIIWNDQVDVCPDALYMKLKGTTPEDLFPNLRKEKVNA